MNEDGDKQLAKQLKPYQWKKGQSGNPAGRPKGKTLKEFAREYLETLPDEEKVDYLASLPTEIVWKMAEGNPENKTDITSKGEKIGNSVSEEVLSEADRIMKEKKLNK